MTRFRPFLSLRVRLILLVLLALIPALAIMLYTAAEMHQREAERVENELDILNQLAAATLEQWVVNIGVPRFEGDNFTAVGGRIFKGGYEK